MGKVYKDKKSSGCALCKPHKHGWAPKKKAKTIALEKKMERELTETLVHADKEEPISQRRFLNEDTTKEESSDTTKVRAVEVQTNQIESIKNSQTG